MIYVVSTFDIVDGYPYRIRPVGLYKSVCEAIDVVVHNRYDIADNSGSYALIEGYEYGTYPDCIKIGWYRWDFDRKCYMACEEPASQKMIYNYVIG